MVLRRGRVWGVLKITSLKFLLELSTSFKFCSTFTHSGLPGFSPLPVTWESGGFNMGIRCPYHSKWKPFWDSTFPGWDCKRNKASWEKGHGRGRIDLCLIVYTLLSLLSLLKQDFRHWLVRARMSKEGGLSPHSLQDHSNKNNLYSNPLSRIQEPNGLPRPERRKKILYARKTSFYLT